MKEKILELKKKKNAVILAHNYQIGEIQDIADYCGDSLNLSKIAAETKADIIIFCGVKFMAETAKILSPDKKVLIPRFDAGCPMADTITANELFELKKKYPGVPVVSYVNTNADVKALTDVCCTSANAIGIINSIKSDSIIFVPDKNLGSYCQKFTDKKIILWEGCCNVHDRITVEIVKNSKSAHPEAKLIMHPECPIETLEFADEVLSTEGMLNYVKKSNFEQFIVGTENGMLHRLKKENPDKEFYFLYSGMICPNMKKINITDLYDSLNKEQFEIILDDEIISKSQAALKKMIEVLK